MRILLLISALSLTFAASIPAQVVAADTATPQSSQPVDTSQNRQVCKKIEVAGSRLHSKKVCMTMAQWDAQRASDRQDVERNQAMRTKGNE